MNAATYCPPLAEGQDVTQERVALVMKYYRRLTRRDLFKWSPTRKRFSRHDANRLFMQVLLNQGGKADDVRLRSEHFVENHFRGRDGFWSGLRRSDDKSLQEICYHGYDGKSYAFRYNKSELPSRLKEAAKIMLEKYEDDPRRIWNVSPDKVNVIYERFLEFPGIGYALAKMAQFQLVRGHGVAGGKLNAGKLSLKPDILVRRVLKRIGITTSERVTHVVATTNALHLKSPVDFDAALWTLGREYCTKTEPACDECPIQGGCATCSR